MGNPTIYYWPPGATTVQSIDLGRVGVLEIEDVRDRRDASPIGGSTTSHDFGGYRLVRIRKERIQDNSTNAALIRQLRTLTTYLQSGRTIGFCLDSAKCWGGLAVGPQLFGGGTVKIARNAFSFLTAGSIAAADQVTIESANPEMLREVALVATAAALSITVTGGLKQTYSEPPVLVRYADLYPALRLPDTALDQAVLTTDRRLYWDFDATFAEYPAEVSTLAQISLEIGGSQLGTFGTLDWSSIQDAVTSQVIRRNRTSQSASGISTNPNAWRRLF